MAGQLWRVVNLYRVITLGYAAILVTRNHGAYGHPAAGLAALAVMAGWTVATFLVYRRPPGRSAWMIAADILAAAVLVVSTRFIDTPARIDAGAPTLPVAWAAAPVLACAVAGGPWAGVAGALAVCAADFAERRTLLPSGTFNSAVLLLIAGGVGGWVVRLGLRAEATIERAARHQAAAIERERLARGIHDSVLQVLALVASRGSALGGEAAELARLAGEQEAELRTLLTADASQPPPSTPGVPEAGAPPDLADLRILIEGHAPRTVQNHVGNALAKLQLHNKAELVRYAMENGLG